MNPHPYLSQHDFEYPTFIRIRRRVAMLRLPYAEGPIREAILETIAIYDDLLGDKAR